MFLRKNGPNSRNHKPRITQVIKYCNKTAGIIRKLRVYVLLCIRNANLQVLLETLEIHKLPITKIIVLTGALLRPRNNPKSHEVT